MDTSFFLAELPLTHPHFVAGFEHWQRGRKTSSEKAGGDFVLTGGEIPAMAVADAVCRMVPGVLPEPACYEEESHWNGLLEYPQYSRPEEWHGRKVPEVLLSGHHENVAKWRKRQSMLRTLRRRPDMFREADFMGTKQDRRLLAEVYDALRQEKQGGGSSSDAEGNVSR